MPDETGPDMSCVPYSRKRAYFILTVPFLILLILVAVYLWSINFALSLIFISLFVTANLLQAYCCAYQECPYAGGFCPAVAGIMPSSILAKIILRKKVKNAIRSVRSYRLSFTAWSDRFPAVLDCQHKYPAGDRLFCIEHCLLHRILPGDLPRLRDKEHMPRR